MVLNIETINNTLGFFFENNVKYRSDLKIFNCKLNYNDYIHNYNYTNPVFTAYNLRFGKGSTPKMAACMRKANSLCAITLNYFYSYFILQHIYRILDGCEEIWILCSSGKNNISRVSAANE